MYLFEHEGINVWVDDNKVIIADDAVREEYPNNEENRRQLVKRAKYIVDEWERQQQG